ncbi:MAG TPA: hypothetical protein VLK33_19795 [Terriglobales bacterium]|nr:hypothetical protein [Terriglobales bacterium]
MAFKKVVVANAKLGVGQKIEGYLLGSTIKSINGEDGVFGLAKLVLKTEDGVKTTYVQEDYHHSLKKGLMTRVSRVKTMNNGEEGDKIEIDQDDTNTISAFDK